MTVQPLPRPRPRSLREATLLEAPQLLLGKVRGLSSTHSLTWLACVPVALFGLGVFNLSAKAAELPELNAAFLANNLWLFIATILVIFMNAGFAMVEAGMCRQKKCCQYPRQKSLCLRFGGYRLLGHRLFADVWQWR